MIGKQRRWLTPGERPEGRSVSKTGRLPLSRQSESGRLCPTNRAHEVEPSWQPARAALAYLARRGTAATTAELAAMLEVSRAESVPNLTRRCGDWLANEAGIRAQLRCLEEKLDGRGPPEKT
jgi:hypothetical protein